MLDPTAEDWSLQQPSYWPESFKKPALCQKKWREVLFAEQRKDSQSPTSTTSRINSHRHRRPGSLVDLLSARFPQKRVIRTCKERGKLLRPSALHLYLQHGYAMPQTSNVHPYRSSQKLFRTERRGLKLFIELLISMDVDESSKQTAIDVSTTTERCMGSHICGGRQRRRLKNGEEKTETFEKRDSGRKLI